MPVVYASAPAVMHPEARICLYGLLVPNIFCIPWCRLPWVCGFRICEKATWWHHESPVLRHICIHTDASRAKNRTWAIHDISVEISVARKLWLKLGVSEKLESYLVLDIQVANSVKLFCCISGTISASLISYSQLYTNGIRSILRAINTLQFSECLVLIRVLEILIRFNSVLTRGLNTNLTNPHPKPRSIGYRGRNIHGTFGNYVCLGRFDSLKTQANFSLPTKIVADILFFDDWAPSGLSINKEHVEQGWADPYAKITEIADLNHMHNLIGHGNGSKWELKSGN
jgi:hypothetical protein